MDFEQAVEVILELENGYSNDPTDPGGETKYGISKRAYPNLDIANLSKIEAIEIYREDYWKPAGCNKLPNVMKLPVFDCAVNQGVRTSTLLLQEASGSKIDGILGPRTINNVRADVDTPWKAKILIEKYMALRAVRYARNIEVFKDWGGVWMRRLFKITLVNM